MNRVSRRERTMLERLERAHQHTKVFGQILRDLWPLMVVVFLLRM